MHVHQIEFQALLYTQFEGHINNHKICISGYLGKNQGMFPLQMFPQIKKKSAEAVKEILCVIIIQLNMQCSFFFFSLLKCK